MAENDVPDGSSSGANAPVGTRRFANGQAVAGALRELLAKILADVPASDIASPDQIATNTPLTEFGLTSVDFLEFVISIEEEFDIEVPDEALVEDALQCLDDWAEYLFQRMSKDGVPAGETLS